MEEAGHGAQRGSERRAATDRRKAALLPRDRCVAGLGVMRMKATIGSKRSEEALPEFHHTCVSGAAMRMTSAMLVPAQCNRRDMRLVCSPR